MRISSDFINELKMRNEIESVISPYVALKKKGNNLVGLCPFHNEKTGSFTVWPENGSYYCFGCGAGGDAITFLMQIEHYDYVEAVKVLADRAGMVMPTDEVDDRAAKLKADIYQANREAAKFYYERLISPEGKEALHYLQGRGLSAKYIKQFGLGFAPDAWDSLKKHLNGMGLSDYVLEQAGLLARTKNNKLIDRFRNRVMFPVMDLRGNFIAFSGRKLSEDDPGGKYVNTADTPVYHKGSFMFALNFAKNHCAKRVILVEGNMDVISLHQAGFPMTVAALGTAFTADQARLLSRYTEEVVVTMDADAAGQKSTDKVLGLLQDAGLKARVLRLPECKDPDEYIKKNGSSRFEALLDGAVSDMEYKLHTASAGFDLSTSDGKIEYLKKAVRILATESDPITKDLYAGRLSALCEVSKDAILQSVVKTAGEMKRQTVRKELGEIIHPKPVRDDVNPERSLYPRAAAAENEINTLLIQHPDLYASAVGAVKEEDFVTDFGRRLFAEITEQLATENRFDFSLAGGRFSPKEIGYLAMIENTRSVGNEPERALRESITVLLEEKNKQCAGRVEDLSTDEWAKQMRRLAEGKK